MIGENTVEFNEIQMCKALETYLKEHEFKETNFTVTRVDVKIVEGKKNEASEATFLIKMKEAEETKVQTINQ